MTWSDGVVFKCPCGERDVYVSQPPHTIDFDDDELMTLDGSVGSRVDDSRDRAANWCHFWIRGGEHEMASDAQCPGGSLVTNSQQAVMRKFVSQAFAAGSFDSEVEVIERAHVIPSRGKGPRPKVSYATLLLVTDERQGYPARAVVASDTHGAHRHHGHRSSTVRPTSACSSTLTAPSIARTASRTG